MQVSIHTVSSHPPHIMEWPADCRLPVAGDYINIDRVTPGEVEVQVVELNIADGVVSAWIDCTNGD